MNRLLEKIHAVRKKKSKLFCAFLTLGYPSLASTPKLIAEFEEQGADMIELGFPFSDPLADGPTIQYSSEMALKNGVHLKDAFHVARALRRHGHQVPLIFFTYFNPVLRFGIKRFVREAKKSGFDGMIIPDLPPEEEKELQAECRRADLPIIFLIAPTTEKQRALSIARASTGFIYYVSLRGVTGARRSLPSDINGHLKALKRKVKKPVLIGFGVSNPKQAKMLSKMADGVIVGSALVDQLRRPGGTKKVGRFVRLMSGSVKAKA